MLLSLYMTILNSWGLNQRLSGRFSGLHAMSAAANTLMNPVGARDTRPPLGLNSFFLIQFSAKILPNNEFLPPNSRFGAPVREILEPQLKYVDQNNKDYPENTVKKLFTNLY